MSNIITIKLDESGAWITKPPRPLPFYPNEKEEQLIAPSPWIKTSEQLPEPGKYVLVRHNRDNWIDASDQENVNCVVAKLVKGISLKEREDMPDCGRKRDILFGDEHGNNERPYRWDTFGRTSFFGQDVDLWMPIPPIK